MINIQCNIAFLRRVALFLVVSVWFANFFAITARPQQRPDLRCGWFVNPTPSNAWLIDRDREWIIAVQGGYQADGDWPDFKPSQWIETNGHYGHGCSCMKVNVNKAEEKIVSIISAYAKPLSACRKDKALRNKEPGD